MSEPLDKFEHLVVVMMENRSFDNLLGYLYGPEDDNFAGVLGHDPPLSNPIPAGASPSADGSRVVPVGKGYVMDDPSPDSGEDYTHVNTQLYGVFNPESNRGRNDYDNKDTSKNLQAPWNVPDDASDVPPMNGFVKDYIDVFTLDQKRPPTYDEYRIIMNCFPPDAVPVLSGLARSFAVCDHWFSSAPTETYPNRSFFHAGTAGGQVLNSPFKHWMENDAPTIFDRIQECEQRGLSWGIYFDAEDVVSLTLLLHFPRLWRYVGSHFHHMDTFYEHLREGKLPNYAFVEPRLFRNQNSMHPPFKELGVTLHSSVLAGEKLLDEIYTAIRNSPAGGSGSHLYNTLFAITFDEHGGCYDHLPPPAAVAPDPQAPAGQLGFRFDRLGLRVPTIFVSAWIAAGTVVNRPLEHASFLRTMCEKWDLEPLTQRDRSAPHIGDIFTAAQPRGRDDWPTFTPREDPSGRTDAAEGQLSLNNLQKNVIRLMAEFGKPSSGSALRGVKTLDHALAFLRQKLGELGSLS